MNRLSIRHRSGSARESPRDALRAGPHGSPPGFILPTALVVVALATLIGAALVSAAFRSAQGVQSALHAERALHAADAALAAERLQWNAARMAALTVGARETTTVARPPDITVQVVAVRVAPTTLVLDARATVMRGTRTLARRELSRAMELDLSRTPIQAAVTVLGVVDAGTLADIRAAQLAAAGAGPGETTCGVDTDTMSSTALLSLAPAPADTILLVGAPRHRAASTTTANAMRAAFWTRVDSLRPVSEQPATPVSITPTLDAGGCAPGSGEPRRGFGALTQCTTAWPVRRIGSTTGRVQLASSRHQGALVVDGDLELVGHLELRGLLVVRGVIDARNGSMDAVGAVVALHHAGGTSHFGGASQVRWSRCAVLRAVTPLATFGSSPVLAWGERY